VTRKAPRTFRRKLALSFTAALGVLLLVFAVQLTVVVRTALHRQMDEALARDLEAAERLLSESPGDLPLVLQSEVLPYVAIDLPAPPGRLETAGWVQAGLGGAPAAESAGSAVEWTNSLGDTFRIRSREPRPGLRLSVARDANDARVALQSLRWTFLIGIPSTLLLAALGGWHLADRALRPVRAMTRTAREITADRLSARLDVENADEEFGQLAAVFNDTLARLEASFNQLRRFTSDASHQLRTPLAAMRAVGENALAPGVGREEARDAIGSLLEEVDRLSRLVESLLTITRAEGGQIPVRTEVVDLGDLARELAATYEVLAEESGLRLKLDLGGGCTARADRLLVQQAVANLLDNALKYTHSGGLIVLRTTFEAGAATLAVIDDGPGIAPEDHSRVFERFHRGEAGGNVPGSGLGLAIARWAAQANGGDITLASGPGRGCEFRLSLPAAPAVH
jgi:heavy metal sensor kinase